MDPAKDEQLELEQRLQKLLSPDATPSAQSTSKLLPDKDDTTIPASSSDSSMDAQLEARLDRLVAGSGTGDPPTLRQQQKQNKTQAVEKGVFVDFTDLVLASPTKNVMGLDPPLASHLLGDEDAVLAMADGGAVMLNDEADDLLEKVQQQVRLEKLHNGENPLGDPPETKDLLSLLESSKGSVDE